MTSHGRKVRVMVVDDDAVVLAITRERLEAAGYEVFTRNVAIGTGAAILRDNPAYVLLDVRMPGLNGDAVAKLLTSGMLPEERPAIILYSSTNHAELNALARSCGAIGIIEKTPSSGYFIQQFTACISAGKSLPPSVRGEYVRR